MAEQGTVVVERFESQALKGNPLRDSNVREIPVYLPPSYERDRSRRYPVIYWLHGFTGIGLSSINRSLWTPTLPELMDRVIADGAPEAVLVMPDGSTRYGGSQYINSPATGRYEDHMIKELVPYVDATYRTKASAGHRGTVGKSSGGYGALVLAMRNPDIFGAVASHSGDMYFEAGYKPFFWKALNVINKHGGVRSFLNAFDAMLKKDREATEALTILVAMAMAYSGNADGTYELPVDVKTGEMRDAIWSKWLEWDPVYMAERHAEALRKMKLVYIECGRKDEWNLHYGARILSGRLKALGINHEHQEFDDDHGNIQYRYVESLRRLSQVLA
ncbi:MAG TPA: alpha/beta hydrolase-fold protein [bacterium]|nr:alpha/beta hydrolase-fold protein [bacterium]